MQRNIQMTELAAHVISGNFDPSGVFLDFAGGYGLFVRLMRDKGFDFYWMDRYCTNLFARFFSHSEARGSYDLITAFELFEHLNDPLTQIRDITNFSGTILFTTHIRPNAISDVEEWWYLVPETGQHVTFYSLNALESLAEKLGMKLYSDGRNTHILSVRDDLVVFAESQTSTPNLLKRVASRLGRRLLEPTERHKNIGQSLVWLDHEKIKQSLRERGDTDEC
ncbi:MAG: class I SAM-dependent methyltransferase [Chromatiaceae bacterium]|nr:class I SAM-dependent methyltransferase [Chromatiaceae bacterium]